jgi:hypothetical protein
LSVVRTSVVTHVGTRLGRAASRELIAHLELVVVGYVLRSQLQQVREWRATEATI